MRNYIMRRIALTIPALVGVSLIIFLLMRVLPGDVALMLLLGEGGESAATPENLATMRHRLGTDRPLYEQYLTWIGGVLRLDPGVSLVTERPVIGEIKRCLPLSLELAGMSLIIALFIALTTGVLSAVRQDTWVDYLFRVVSIAGIAMPGFWTGTLFIIFVALWFGWMPPVGYAPIWEDPQKNILQMLPAAVVLGYYLAALLSRMTRSCMLEVLRDDYIRTARAKGLQESLVIFRHALKNALLPVLTLLGVQLGTLIGGAVIIETVFTLPGMGLTLVSSVTLRDYTMVQTFVLFIAVAYAVVNLAVDLLYGWLDPRIRFT